MLSKFRNGLIAFGLALVAAVLVGPVAMAAPADPVFSDIELAIPAGEVFATLLAFGGVILVTSLTLAVGFVLTRRMIWRSTSGI